jgi:hypothetical protein
MAAPLSAEGIWIMEARLAMAKSTSSHTAMNFIEFLLSGSIDRTKAGRTEATDRREQINDYLSAVTSIQHLRTPGPSISVDVCLSELSREWNPPALAGSSGNGIQGSNFHPLTDNDRGETWQVTELFSKRAGIAAMNLDPGSIRNAEGRPFRFIGDRPVCNGRPNHRHSAVN